MTPADQARLLLRKAQQDQVILQQLLDDPLITDESLGFMGHQAAGPLLKVRLRTTAQGPQPAGPGQNFTTVS